MLTSKKQGHFVPPLVLFCDFGLPYTGQMKAVLCAAAPGVPVIDLMLDVPTFNIQAGATLLAAHADEFPKGSVFVCVVDPGVGSSARLPGAVFAGGRWFVGPLNGLFDEVLRRWPKNAEVFEITPIADDISNTFHGRDLFCPVAARLAQRDKRDKRDQVDLSPVPMEVLEFGSLTPQIIYIDGFGNLMTNVWAKDLGSSDSLQISGITLPRLRTYADCEVGSLIAYENAVGLMEIAVNQGNASDVLQTQPGTPVKIV